MNTVDASGDVHVDTGVDTGTGGDDAGDAGKDVATDTGKDSSPQFDAGPFDPLTFTHQMNQLYCQKAGFCCPGGLTNFNVDACTAVLDNDPFSIGAFGNRAFAPYVDGGHMTVDPTKANQCFTAINALDCTNIPSATYLQIENVCFGAAVGQIPSDGTAGCSGSAECAAPGHCDPDGGICEPARTAGTPCGLGMTAPYTGAADQCGRFTSGNPGYCDTDYTFPLNDDPNGSSTFTCKAPKANGHGCYTSTECASGICGHTNNATWSAAGAGECVDVKTVLIKQDFCDAYPKDAGPG